jgi:transposase
MAKHSTNPKTRKTHATRRSIGIDLGDRFSELYVLDGEGALVSRARLRTTSAALQEYFSAQAPVRVALETGTHSGWVSRIAAFRGHGVIVVNAREVRTIYQSDRKNERCSQYLLRGVWIHDECARD